MTLSARNSMLQPSPWAEAVVQRYSFIRTVTVGHGIAPCLLTPGRWALGARGLLQPEVTDTAGEEFHLALRTLLA